jgi:hypothetical protein
LKALLRNEFCGIAGEASNSTQIYFELISSKHFSLTKPVENEKRKIQLAVYRFSERRAAGRRPASLRGRFRVRLPEAEGRRLKKISLLLWCPVFSAVGRRPKAAKDLFTFMVSSVFGRRPKAEGRERSLEFYGGCV